MVSAEGCEDRHKKSGVFLTVEDVRKCESVVSSRRPCSQLRFERSRAQFGPRGVVLFPSSIYHMPALDDGSCQCFVVAGRHCVKLR